MKAYVFGNYELIDNWLDENAVEDAASTLVVVKGTRITKCVARLSPPLLVHSHSCASSLLPPLDHLPPSSMASHKTLCLPRNINKTFNEK